jgi:hypothetical protein
MRMVWWFFIFFLAAQIILIQFMAESYLAGHHNELPYYSIALGFVFAMGVLMYLYFRRVDETKD